MRLYMLPNVRKQWQAPQRSEGTQPASWCSSVTSYARVLLFLFLFMILLVRIIFIHIDCFSSILILEQSRNGISRSHYRSIVHDNTVYPFYPTFPSPFPFYNAIPYHRKKKWLFELSSVLLIYWTWPNDIQHCATQTVVTLKFIFWVFK